MTKITLKAHIPEHREIAKMFVGFEITSAFACDQPLVELIGVTNEDFVTNYEPIYTDDFGNEYSSGNYSDLSEITIDTSEAEMDLRLAIGTDIEFELPWYKTPRKIVEAKVDDSGELLVNYNSMYGNLAEGVKLSKDYLERIGVEYED